jgi:hypothetical protein
MPLVVLRTGFTDPDGREETLKEYFCDRPDCSNVAVHVLGVVREIGQVAMVCDDHAPQAPGAPDGPNEGGPARSGSR